MATTDDDVKEDSVHSHLVNALVSNVDEEALSPDDVAWADSCLMKDVDASAADWSSIKDALLEILSSQSEPTANSSVAQSSMEVNTTDEVIRTANSSVAHSSMEVNTTDEVIRFHENLTSMEFGAGFDKDEDFIDDKSGEVESIAFFEDDEDDHMLSNKRSRRRGKGFGNVFRPNYSEDIKVEELDSDLNLSLTVHEMDSSLEDIFKVWDLGISDEQDDFTKQLDKALSEIPPQSQSNVTDSTAFKDMMHVSIDDLIAGIGDLSLKQTTN